MKIKQKLVIEVIVLSIILASASVIVVNNTLLVAETFASLNNELIPTLLLLKDMRMVASNILALTLEATIIENESLANNNDLEKRSDEIAEINKEVFFAKSQFNELFNLYEKYLMDQNDFDSANEIFTQWKKYEINSEKFIEYRMKGISDAEFIKLTEQFKESRTALFKEIDHTILENENKVREKRDAISKLVENTTIILVGTVISILIIILAVRIYILKSIFVPILRIRDFTKKIAAGNFKLRLNYSSNDEIGELTGDIDQMAGDLEISQEKLLKTEKLLVIGTLAARMAHDIRNPLAIIRGGIDYLKLKQPYQEKDLATFKTINKAIDRITHQIEEVLDFVKMTPLIIEPVSILSLLKQTKSNLELPDSIQVELPEKDISIECDHRKIEVVLINLLRNSVDALGNSGSIKVRLEDMGEFARIEIEDSGPGIPEEVQSKIFDPLFTTKQRGTGLGLTSVKNIIEEHGGTIVFSNNPTVFSILLPKRNPYKKDEKIDSSQNP